MTQESLVTARKKAERAVEGMPDGPLKIAAFQTILAKLLTEPEESVPAKVINKGAAPETLPGRILALRSEGLFKVQRSLSEIREALGSRGWHYPLTTLSGATQALVRQRQLRRERVGVGNKQVWKYSNP
jgi:hypothetical protein